MHKATLLGVTIFQRLPQVYQTFLNQTSLIQKEEKTRPRGRTARTGQGPGGRPVFEPAGFS
ncbi:hypothetical protein DXX99_07910 [Ammonifex thiophilus]|uniref:Uncharacterized protein n=1 Tax=Ammonifex thiophilus TaxID=444093 RepID=A0A3D8P429_9THEO|nr:hypothetical protein DXX99_07910 [Ammonifex thiophilus]